MKSLKVLFLVSLFLSPVSEIAAFGMPKLELNMFKINISKGTADVLNQHAPLLLFGGLYLASQSPYSRKLGGVLGFTNGEVAALGAAGALLKAMEYIPFLNQKRNKLYWGSFAFAAVYKCACSVWVRRGLNALCGLAGEDRKPFTEDELNKDAAWQTRYADSNDDNEIKKIDAMTRNNMSKALLTGALYSLVRGPWFEFGKKCRF